MARVAQARTNKKSGSARSQKRAALAQAARLVQVPTHADLCVVGAGAAGIVAATVAADKGLKVVALDASVECAHSILATGNGRCNFSNIELGTGAFNAPDFVAPTLGQTPLDDVLAYFRDCGLGWVQQDGRLYPRSLNAQSVRDVLVARAVASGAILAPQRRVTTVAPLSAGGSSYRVTFEDAFIDSDAAPQQHTLEAKAVILATGGGLQPAFAPLKLEEVPLTPALCALECEPTPFVEADGKRSSAACVLWHNGAPVLREMGEVLFRTYGLSGIAIFNLSRLAQPGDVISLDLLWECSSSEVAGRAKMSTPPASDLRGFLDPTLAALIAREANSEDIFDHIRLAKNLRFTVTGLADTNHAQVTRGGLALSGFNPETLASTTHPGLFACGEALDIDGACGGYNLSWAWLSGIRAAQSAVQNLAH